jgi:hypothetical protein
LLDIRILLKSRPGAENGRVAEYWFSRSQKTGPGTMEGRWKRGEIEVKAQAADNRKIRLHKRGG